MPENKTGDVRGNEEWENCGSHPSTDSQPGIPGGEKENTNLETDDNTRSYAQVTCYQKISKSPKMLYEMEMGIVIE